MGIRPYKTFTFDGVSSANYGVYLTGEGVFNAPERDVEQIEIPGRNGNFALDQGRFKNISVTYKAGMYGTDESTFATKISNFRNWLCSKKGYCRLEDDYNSGEYRMAVYSKGLDVDPTQLIAGEFEITFECKPQRWLTSGETESSSIPNNGIISNPTLFDSSPLLSIKGYGNLAFNGYAISIIDDVTGEVEVSNGQYNQKNASIFTITLDSSLMNTSDTFLLSGVSDSYSLTPNYGVSLIEVIITSTSNISFNPIDNGLSYNIIAADMSFVYGTSSTQTASASFEVHYTEYGTEYYQVMSYSLTAQYGGSDTLTITINGIGTGSVYRKSEHYVTIPPIVADSTKSVLGNPTYIDCDLGECYKIHNDEIFSLNRHIDLGSDLPVLSPGTNKFTKSNTITELKVTPRWWKI